MSIETYINPEDRRLSRMHIEAQGDLIAVKWQIGDLSSAGGADRGIVTEFSAASRRRMIRKMARLNIHRGATFLTLTYPERYPDPQQAKEHLRALHERFRRRWPKSSGMWRLEFQQRGAPHFHMLYFGLPFIPFETIRTWWSEIISEYVDEYQPRVKIEWVRSKRGAMHYISKYVGKMPDEMSGYAPCGGGGGGGVRGFFIYDAYPHVGRWWGVFNNAFLPYASLAYIQVRIETGKAFYDAKRLLRRFYPNLSKHRHRGGVVFAKCAYQLHSIIAAMALDDINDEWGKEQVVIGA